MYMYFNGCPLRDAVCNMLTFNNVKKLKVNISNIFSLHCFLYFSSENIIRLYVYIYIYIYSTNILMEKIYQCKIHLFLRYNLFKP